MLTHVSCRGTGEVVHLEEEFRLLTLQVIGEAILSLPPEECDRVSSCWRFCSTCATASKQQQAWGAFLGQSQLCS